MIKTYTSLKKISTFLAILVVALLSMGIAAGAVSLGEVFYPGGNSNIDWPLYTYEAGKQRPVEIDNKGLALEAGSIIEINIPRPFIWRCTNGGLKSSLNPKINMSTKSTGQSNVLWDEPRVDTVMNIIKFKGVVIKVDPANPDYVLEISLSYKGTYAIHDTKNPGLIHHEPVDKTFLVHERTIAMNKMGVLDYVFMGWGVLQGERDNRKFAGDPSKFKIEPSGTAIISGVINIGQTDPLNQAGNGTGTGGNKAAGNSGTGSGTGVGTGAGDTNNKKGSIGSQGLSGEGTGGSAPNSKKTGTDSFVDKVKKNSDLILLVMALLSLLALILPLITRYSGGGSGEGGIKGLNSLNLGDFLGSLFQKKSIKADKEQSSEQQAASQTKQQNEGSGSGTGQQGTSQQNTAVPQNQEKTGDRNQTKQSVKKDYGDDV